MQDSIHRAFDQNDVLEGRSILIGFIQSNWQDEWHEAAGELRPQTPLPPAAQNHQAQPSTALVAEVTRKRARAASASGAASNASPPRAPPPLKRPSPEQEHATEPSVKIGPPREPAPSKGKHRAGPTLRSSRSTDSAASKSSKSSTSRAKQKASLAVSFSRSADSADPREAGPSRVRDTGRTTQQQKVLLKLRKYIKSTTKVSTVIDIHSQLPLAK